MKIVIVYLGKKVPKYVKSNIKYLSYTFPNERFVILIDQAKFLDLESMENVECVRLQDPYRSWTTRNQLLDNSTRSKNDFWYKTLARFKIIEDYMLVKNEKILHIEADVLLSPNFPFNLIKSINQNFAFPLINDLQGIASLLYIKNHAAAKELIRFSEKVLNDFPDSTDMDILGKLYKDRLNDVYVLPTIDSNAKLSAKQFKLSINDAASHFKTFNGVFDGATIGQFFFGLDRIHSSGLLKRYIYLAHHFVDPRNFNILIEEHNFYLSHKGSLIEVYNLHLHSKINQFFSLQRSKLKKYSLTPKVLFLSYFSLITYYRSKHYIIKHQFQKIISVFRRFR